MSLEDRLGIPAFLRRSAPAPAAEADAPEEEPGGSSSNPPAPPPPPDQPWLDRLEALLTAPAPEVAALIATLREGLDQLATLGEAALVMEGRDLVAWLEGDSLEALRPRLNDWFLRVRERMAQPADPDRRRLWWRHRG